jgi:hypothetical protein
MFALVERPLGFVAKLTLAAVDVPVQQSVCAQA